MTARELYDSSPADAAGPTFRDWIDTWVAERACPWPLVDWLLEQERGVMTCPACSGSGTYTIQCTNPSTSRANGYSSLTTYSEWRGCRWCGDGDLIKGRGTVPDPSIDLLAEAVRWAAAFPLRPVCHPVMEYGERTGACGLFPMADRVGVWVWTVDIPDTHASDLPDEFEILDDTTHSGLREFPAPLDAILWLLDECARLRLWEVVTS